VGERYRLKARALSVMGQEFELTLRVPNPKVMRADQSEPVVTSAFAPYGPRLRLVPTE
jgi:hypothetical protein